MKKLLLSLTILFTVSACTNGKHAEYEKNTEKAKAFFKLHESEQAEEMFEYLHEDIQWHMPVYGMGMGGKEDLKAAILGYQAEFENMKFTADYWLPGVDSETGTPDGSTRVYGTWNSIHSLSGKETTLTSYHSFEFKDGKIINGGDWFDASGMMNSVAPVGLSKDNLMGFHKLNVTLNNGYTMQDFENYFTKTLIPAYNSAFMGAKVHLIKGIKGKDVNSLGMLWIFESSEFVSKFWNSNGTSTDLNNSINEGLNDINAGLSVIGSWTSEFTDWTVQ